MVYEPLRWQHEAIDTSISVRQSRALVPHWVSPAEPTPSCNKGCFDTMVYPGMKGWEMGRMCGVFFIIFSTSSISQVEVLHQRTLFRSTFMQFLIEVLF